jgi:hypothetical protein
MYLYFFFQTFTASDYSGLCICMVETQYLKIFNFHEYSKLWHFVYWLYITFNVLFQSYTASGYGHLPICMAKTQYSLSTDAAAKGVPKVNLFCFVMLFFNSHVFICCSNSFCTYAFLAGLYGDNSLIFFVRNLLSKHHHHYHQRVSLFLLEMLRLLLVRDIFTLSAVILRPYPDYPPVLVSMM